MQTKREKGSFRAREDARLSAKECLFKPAKGIAPAITAGLQGKHRTIAHLLAVDRRQQTFMTNQNRSGAAA
jgi:hypothetical protein